MSIEVNGYALSEHEQIEIRLGLLSLQFSMLMEKVDELPRDALPNMYLHMLSNFENELELLSFDLSQFFVSVSAGHYEKVETTESMEVDDMNGGIAYDNVRERQGA